MGRIYRKYSKSKAVSIRLFQSDLDYARERGFSLSGMVRSLVHAHVLQLQDRTCCSTNRSPYNPNLFSATKEKTKKKPTPTPPPRTVTPLATWAIEIVRAARS